jgi:glycosyltransferase involved in cell wall biosynthesis
MTLPLVSVILVVRNGERFLRAALDSVQAQDYRPLDVIVVDGQSTDSSVAIAASYSEVRIIHQIGRGVADATNLGIRAARGELLAFLSSDDLWTPDKLSAQVRYLSEHPEVQCCVSRVKLFLEEGCPMPRGFKPELLDGDHVAVIPEAVMTRKAVFETVGEFDTRFRVSHDTDWFARAKDAGISIGEIPQVHLLRRVHDANASSNAPVVHRELIDIVRQSVRRQRARGGNTGSAGATAC